MKRAEPPQRPYRCAAWLLSMAALALALVLSTPDDARAAVSPPVLSPFDVITNPVPGSRSRFGAAVTIDGSRVIVGDPGYNNRVGRVYIYDVLDPGNPTILNIPDPGVRGAGQFGSALSAHNGVLAVASASTGGGFVDLFDLDTGQRLRTLQPTGVVADGAARFGSSLALHSGRLVVGSVLEDDGATDAGAVYLFDTTTGQQLHRILAPRQQDGGQFGLAVDLDDSRFIVGSSTGQAHLYNTQSGTRVRTLAGRSSDLFGTDVALSESSALVGAIGFDRLPLVDTGAVFRFDKAIGFPDGAIELDPLFRGAEFGRDLDTHGDLLAALAAGNSDSPQAGFIIDTQTGEQLAILDPGIDPFDGDIAMNGQYAALTRSTGRSNQQAVYVFNVPEPSSLALLALGLGAMARRRR